MAKRNTRVKRLDKDLIEAIDGFEEIFARDSGIEGDVHVRRSGQKILGNIIKDIVRKKKKKNSDRGNSFNGFF